MPRTYIVFGWMVSYEKLMDFLIQNRAGSCQGKYRRSENGQVTLHSNECQEEIGREYQCMCRCCWKRVSDILPKGVRIEHTFPSDAMDKQDGTYYINLLTEKEEDSILPSSMLYGLDEGLVRKGRDVAELVGVNEEVIRNGPYVFSVLSFV